MSEEKQHILKGPWSHWVIMLIAFSFFDSCRMHMLSKRISALETQATEEPTDAQ